MVRTVRVATWNIGSLYTDYERNLDYLQSVIRSVDTDILCMQETPKQPALWENICTWGGFPHRLYHTTSISHICTDNDMGISVFSRFPIEQLEIRKLTKPTVEIFYNGKQEYWHDKYFMAVKCVLGDRPVMLVTGHGFPFHRYGLENPENHHLIAPSFRELDTWLAALPETCQLPVLCAAADFNITDPLPFMPKTAAQYRDVFHGDATRPSGRKTDGILIPGGISDVKKTNIPAHTIDGQRIFDHNFIMAELPL